MDKNKIAENLKTLRGEMSVADLSVRLGVGASAIYMYEAGERVPNDEVKIKYAKVFNKSVDEIFFQ